MKKKITLHFSIKLILLLFFYSCSYLTGPEPNKNQNSNSPQISFTIPAEGDTSISVDSDIQITFDQGMDTNTVYSNTGNNNCSGTVQISYDNFSTCVQIASYNTINNNKTFTFTPVSYLSLDSDYQLKVTTGVMNSQGIPMANETIIGFRTSSNVPSTVGNLELVFSHPENGEVNVSTIDPVAIIFNQTLNTSTVTSNSGSSSCIGTTQISIDNFATCIPMNPPQFTSNQKGVYLSPIAPFSANTPYQVKVTTGISSTLGKSLPSDNTINFTTSTNSSPNVYTTNPYGRRCECPPKCLHSHSL